MKTLKRIDIMSFAKFQTFLMAMIGLLVGVMVAFFGFIFQAFAGRFMEGGESLPAFGAGLGVAALIILPVMYAVIGFVTGLIGGALFNLVSRISGGIRVELE
jgi:hypothetical protein